MNTIKNPLILRKTKINGEWIGGYTTNSIEDCSGEYIDKALAEEMLELLEDQYYLMEDLRKIDHSVFLTNKTAKLRELIIKIKDN